MAEEKRRFSRVVFKMAAELTVKDAVYRVDEIVDLSVGGCQLGIAEVIEEGTSCSLVITLNPADRRSNVAVDGYIARSDGKSVGVKFTSIEPEPLAHLQNIIRYNSPDPDRIEDEIDERPGLV